MSSLYSNASHRQVLNLLKATAVNPVAEVGTVALDVNVSPVVVPVVEAPIDVPPSPSSEVQNSANNSPAESLDLTHISKEYNKQLQLFSAYISELKCIRLTESNKNTLKNYIAIMEKIHVDFLHNVIKIQNNLDSKN